MSILYLECVMGASGDMLISALVDLLPDRYEFARSINDTMSAIGVTVEIETSQRKGLTGLHTEVLINGNVEGLGVYGHEHDNKSHDEHGHCHGINREHTHIHNDSGSLNSIYKLIDELPLSQKVKDDARSIYNLIAQAESKVHGTTVEQVHFHEVGALDAVCDIVAVCMLIEMLSPDKVIASPVHVGSGTVMSMHGRLPVPAPATAELLVDIPIYGGDIEGELCTPTGAALLKYFVHEFKSMPAMSVEKIGYGMGTKDFHRSNCLRAFFGSSVDSMSTDDQISELCCNIDDMSPEAVGFSAELLRSNGALEVFVVPAQTKKNRPCFLLTCLCNPQDELKMAQLILRHTSTFGLRRALRERYTLSRCIKAVDTVFGPVRVKYGEGYGIDKYKPEYEDMAAISQKNGLPISKIYDEIIRTLT